MTQDRITSPFTATSTAAEVTAGIDLHGTRAIVTGGSSGIGIETARALARAGAAVTLAVRDPGAGRRVATEINAGLDRELVTVAPLDLIDPDSPRRLAEQWGTTPLHVLIGNAGIMAPPLQRTPAGWESQFAINHLGHFALASALHDALAAAGGARIVSVSSRGHLRSPVDFDDINFTERAYDPWLAYGQSKTANVLFAVEATRRWAAEGITANAVHPGGIWTNLVRYLPDDLRESLRTDPDAQYKTPEQGAATSVFVATSPLLDGSGGRYFEDCNQAVRYTGGPERVGVADYALDPDAARRLWELSTIAIR
jgi:NAD(P)-dependent dehydrogenase (short-subunit alcohol dehydrogenase family)